MEELGQVCGDNDGGRYIQQMVGQLLKGGLIDNLEALFDVSFQDVLYQRTDVALVILDYQQLREASLLQVFVKGCPAEALGLSGAAFSVHLFHYTVLLEGEGVKRNLLVAAGQEGGQFAAEELGIGAGNDDVHLLTQ